MRKADKVYDMQVALPQLVSGDCEKVSAVVKRYALHRRAAARSVRPRGGNQWQRARLLDADDGGLADEFLEIPYGDKVVCGPQGEPTVGLIDLQAAAVRRMCWHRLHNAQLIAESAHTFAEAKRSWDLPLDFGS